MYQNLEDHPNLLVVFDDFRIMDAQLASRDDLSWSTKLSLQEIIDYIG